MKRHLIYFFGTDFDRVKIGRCKANLYSRQQQIQVGCPDPIKLLGIILCKDRSEMSSKERELHRKFQDYRTVGEWFRLVPEISAYIAEFTESGEDILKKDHQRFRERNCEGSRRRREDNPEYEHDRKSDWYQNNREEILVKNREHQHKKEVRERRSEYARERYQNNPEVRERHRQYRERPEVRERRREYKRQYDARNRKRRPVCEQTLSLPGID